MTRRERRDPYVVLGVPRQASGDEITRAYRVAARASHPDCGAAGSAEQFRAVSDAYEVLRDPRRRAVYDRSYPPAGSRSGRAQRGSVRYATPGSQHVVLGGRAAEQPTVEEMFRIVLSLLRAGW
ncbi:MAG TPA: J domain-containing protein [Gaiellaceae bacterium]|nr:J domain-containing protein [Gaiellaceae bacterium]